MKKIIVRYKVKPERVEENKQLIKNIFEELNTTRPPGLRYASYSLADNVSFIHFVSIETPDGINPLNSLEAFKEFTKNLMTGAMNDPCHRRQLSLDRMDFDSIM